MSQEWAKVEPSEPIESSEPRMCQGWTKSVKSTKWAMWAKSEPRMREEWAKNERRVSQVREVSRVRQVSNVSQEWAKWVKSGPKNDPNESQEWAKSVKSAEWVESEPS